MISRKFTKTSRGHIIAAGLVALTMLGAECDQEAPQPDVPEQGQELLDRVEEGAAVREALLEELKGLDSTELIRRLEADSQEGREPFNSPAYREVVSREAEIAPDLEQSLGRGRGSLLSLLALRDVDEQRYRSVSPEVRLEILLDAFRASRTFNLWGVPHLYFEDAAQAVIDLGPLAVPSLRQFLDDKTPAPVYGDEEAAEFRRYEYRVADYALAFILAITDQEVELPVDPGARDDLIDGVL